jgi:Flp pilus assembly protein TadG
MRLAEHSRRRRRSSGQALVEFTMIIPIFMLLVVSVCELSMFLTVKIGVTDAAQDAVQLAAQLGNGEDTDFNILKLVEKDMSAPIDKSKIQSVAIFKTDLTGKNYGASDTYVRGGSLPNKAGTDTVPYSISGSKGYPEGNRCNSVAISICGGVQWIGVTITYQYTWLTAFPTLIGLGSTNPTITQTSSCRLEPIQ